MKLYIKYMVSNCCKLMVKEKLRNLGLHPTEITLGEVEINEEISSQQHDEVRHTLKKMGLELLEDKRSIQIEKIKTAIIEMIHYSDEPPEVNYSEYISRKLEYDYTYISKLFSEVTGFTIQQYIITHRIERAKELIIYDELSLKEIAYKLHYSSIAHFSNQFKKVTGLAPSFFKSLKVNKRMAIDTFVAEEA